MLGALICASQIGGYCADNRSSPNLATGVMTPTFTARAVGTSGTDVRAFLEVPAEDFGEDWVDFEDGDRLVATRIDPETGEETDKVLFEHGGNHYGVGFPHEAKDTEIVIAFDRRATGRTSAPDSSVTLPTPFELDWVDDPVAMSDAPEPFSRSSATPYYVVWDPFDAPDFVPGDVLTYQVSGRCVLLEQGTIDWQGGEDALELTNLLDDAGPPNDGTDCPIRVELTLRRAGTVDPAYAGGSFVAEQVRVMNLRSTP